jgi:hypothetical protein
VISVFEASIGQVRVPRRPFFRKAVAANGKAVA